MSLPSYLSARLRRPGRPRLTYANVTSTLALAIALGVGGAYAAPLIGPGDIKDNAVRSKHIDDKAVARSEIKNGSVTKAKLDDPDALKTKVTRYRLGAWDFAVSSSLAKVLPGDLTAAQVANSEWSFQLVRASGNVYPVPGPGVNATSTYRAYIDADGQVSIYRASGTGEDYADVQVIRTVPISSEVVTSAPRRAPRER